MNTFKKYWLVLAIILTVLLAVLYRSFNNSGFRYDAPKLASPSVQGSNIITEDQLPALKNYALIIDMSLSGILNNKYNEITLTADPDSILQRNNIGRIRNHKGPVILASNDNSISARIWMLLSQKGLKNIFILSPEKDFEVLKNKFRPDSLSMPEL